MKSRVFFAAVVFMVVISVLSAEQLIAKEHYDDEEAYKVYSVLLPNEESYGFAKGTLVIREDTVQKQESYGTCLTATAASKFKDAISDFERMESKGWLLQRKFQVEKPYNLVGSDMIDRIFRQNRRGWNDFY